MYLSISELEMSLTDVASTDHAVFVGGSDLEGAVACGALGGPLQGPDDLAVALEPLHTSVYSGTALLHQETGATSVYLVVVEAPVAAGGPASSHPPDASSLPAASSTPDAGDLARAERPEPGPECTTRHQRRTGIQPAARRIDGAVTGQVTGGGTGPPAEPSEPRGADNDRGTRQGGGRSPPPHDRVGRPRGRAIGSPRRSVRRDRQRAGRDGPAIPTRTRRRRAASGRSRTRLPPEGAADRVRADRRASGLG